MNFISHYQCTICDATYDKKHDYHTCPSCGEKGILDIVYDYEKMKLVVTKDYLKDNPKKNILKYQPMMSIKETNAEILDVGNTPLYKSKNLSNQLGLQDLYIKDEGVNPTASLKDRASVVACLKAIEKGNDTVACSSTGNAASSLAGNAAKLGLKAVIFVPKRAPLGKLTQLVLYGSNVIKVDGDYKDTFQASKLAIKKYDLYNRNAAINPHLVEGKKTVIYEVMEQLDFRHLDYVIVSVGDGCTIGAVYKGLYDLKQLDLIEKIPKIIGVQAEGCSPFYKAFINKTEVLEDDENTIADSIAVGIPRNPVKGMNAVKKSGGFYITVTDNEILDAIKVLGKEEGIFAEPAGAASAAGLIKIMKNNFISKNSKVVIIATGNGLKDVNSVSKIVQESTLHYNPRHEDEMLQNKTIKEYIKDLKQRGERGIYE